MHFNPPPTSYQEIPYADDPYRSSHPDHLATVAILSGLEPPALEGCRVLELGCARGGNLIPMAAGMPSARFLGIDSSPLQVQEACELIEKLGLANIRVEVRDILELDSSIGTFDYIICYGTFSWVGREVQERILELSGRCLAGDGIAYTNYNTYPGWHFRGLVREMMSYHARRFLDPAARAREARAILNFMAISAEGIEPVYSTLLKQELEYVSARNDSYLLHDHLESVNEPVYFHDFVERARGHGLRFVSEVQNTSIPPESLPEGVAKGLRELARDEIEFGQFQDFVINRRFRQSVLCRAGVEARPSGSALEVERLYVAVRSVGDDHGSAALRDHPIVAKALEHLHRCWPLSMSFESLLGAAQPGLEESAGPETIETIRLRAELRSGLLRCYDQKRVELCTRPPSFVGHVSNAPVASALARVQARTGNMVTNMRHESGQLNEFGREVICLLDGVHDRAAIIEELMRALSENRITIKRTGGEDDALRPLEEIVEEALDDCLRKISRFALLVE